MSRLHFAFVPLTLGPNAREETSLQKSTKLQNRAVFILPLKLYAKEAPNSEICGLGISVHLAIHGSI